MAGGLPLTLAWLALVVPGDDRVVLGNGKELLGRVVYEDRQRVVLRVQDKDVEFDRKEVTRVSSNVRELADLLSNDARMGSTPEDLLFLSEQARECGLEGEEHSYLWRRLLRDSDDEGINKALGHRRSGSGWLVPMGSRTVSIANRVRLAADWSTAWEFSTLHYRVRSNLDVETTLGILLDLERLYLAVYEVFGEELRLYEICAPMNVALHASSVSYPETGAEGGYYAIQTDTIHVDASKGFQWHLLAHEATHQVLQNALLLGEARTEVLPSWLNEGLAEYVAAAVSHPDRTLVFHPGALRRDYFQLHAATAARERLDLSRVLVLESGDYRASTDRDLKYAQSYTFVHFLLHGEDQRYRAGFLEFLGALGRGKRSSSELKKRLGISSWRTLEREWTAYVERVGG